MSNWNNLKQAWQKLMRNQNFRTFLSSPVTKIIGINSLFFLLWRIKGVSETFMVKHFSFDRFNIRQHRYHTMLTYAFSHFGTISYIFNMIVIASFGRALRMNYGNKVLWWLYILGAIGGGITMQLGMPNMPMIVPQVGADAAIASMLTFFGLFNMQHTVMLFFVPVPMWALLILMGIYSFYEPSKKNVGGMLAGLLVYQLFKIRII